MGESFALNITGNGNILLVWEKSVLLKGAKIPVIPAKCVACIMTELDAMARQNEHSNQFHKFLVCIAEKYIEERITFKNFVVANATVIIGVLVILQTRVIEDFP